MLMNSDEKDAKSKLQVIKHIYRTCYTAKALVLSYFENDPLKTITKKRRSTVPITVQTASLLKEAQAYAETGYVIEYMGKPLQDMKRTFNSAVAKAGLKKVTPHVLKHTAISWLSQGSHSIEKISEITATHPNTVRRIYRKFAPEFLQDEAEYLGKCLDFADLAAKKQQAQQEHVA